MTARSRSRAVAPAPDVSVPVAIGAVAIGAAATVWSLPGGLLALVGVAVAGYLVHPPELTGRKDRQGRPTAANPGEQGRMDAWGIWCDVRWRLLVPTTDLAPGRDVAGVWVAGVCLALVTLARGVRPDWPWWLAPASALAWFWVVAQVAASRRRGASRFAPSPGVRAASLVALVRDGRRGMVLVVASALVGVGAGVAVAVLAGTHFEVGPLGWWGRVLAGVGVGVLSGVGVLWPAWSRAALEDWRELVASALAWEGRWEAMGVKDSPPRLLERSKVGAAVVETFESLQSGSAAYLNAVTAEKVVVALGAGQRAVVLETPNLDASGQPSPGTVHPRIFEVVAYPADGVPDLADPAVTQEEAELAMRAAVAWASDEQRYARSVFTDAARITLHSPGPDGETGSPVAVWASGWAGIIGGMALRSVVGPSAGGQIGTGVLVDSRARGGAGVMFFGAPGDDAAVYDPSMPFTGQTFDELAEEDMWRGRWTSVLKQKVNAPRPEFKVAAEAELVVRVSPGGRGSQTATVHYLPFITLTGEPPEQYFGLESQLKATLNGAPFLASFGFEDRGAKVSGERHRQAFALSWSQEHLPMGPQDLPAQQGDAARWVLAGRINDAFRGARLAQPEVFAVRAQTEASSRGHIWRIDVRLYGGVTLSDVQGATDRLQKTLGCPWLRVEPSDTGCSIYAGVSPIGAKVSSDQVREKLSQLDWERGWLVSNVRGAGGTAPTQLSLSTLPRNTDVQVIDFALPAPVSVTEVRSATAKLRASMGLSFIEVRALPEANRVRLLASELNPLPERAGLDYQFIDESAGLPLATGVDGEPVEFDPKVDPHLLVAGLTGGGKSIVLQNALYGAIVRGWSVVVIDPVKGAADFRFAVPYATSVATTVMDAQAAMKAVYAQVVARKTLNSEHGVGSYRDLPAVVRPAHMLVVIDEFTSLLGADTVPKESGDPDADAEREKVLESNAAKALIGTMAGKIAREARSAGVTLLLATQKLTAKTLDSIPGAGDLRTNMSRMIVGKATQGDLQAALRAPFDAPDMGATIPPGRGLWESTSGAPALIQGWYEPGEQQVLAEQLAERREPLDEAERIDLAAFLPRKKAAPMGVFDDEPLDEGGDEGVIDMGEFDLGLDLDLDLYVEPGDVPLVPVEDPAPAEVEVPSPAEVEVVALPPVEVEVPDVEASESFVVPTAQVEPSAPPTSVRLAAGPDSPVDLSMVSGPSQDYGFTLVEVVALWLGMHPEVIDVVVAISGLDEEDMLGTTVREHLEVVCERQGVTVAFEDPDLVIEPGPALQVDPPSVPEPEPEPDAAPAPEPEPAPARRVPSATPWAERLAAGEISEEF